MAHPEVIGLRGGPKAKWLRDNQPKVIAYWQKHGTSAALVQFRIGQIDTLERLLTRAGVILWPYWQYYQGADIVALPASDESPVAGAEKGQGKRRLIWHLPDRELMERRDPYGLGLMAKHRWMQLHRHEIIEYYRGHGHLATCVKFHCNSETLAHFLGMPRDKNGRIRWKSAIPVPGNHIERQVDILNARVLAEIEGRRTQLKEVRELREEIAGLHDEYNRFVSLVAERVGEVLGGGFQSVWGRLLSDEAQELPVLRALPAPQARLPSSTEIIREAEQIATRSDDAEEEKLYWVAIDWLQRPEQECLQHWGRQGLIALGLYVKETSRLARIISELLFYRCDFRKATVVMLHNLCMPRPKPGGKGFKKEWQTWLSSRAGLNVDELYTTV